MTADAMLDAARLVWPAPAKVTIGRPATDGPASGRRLEFVLVPSAEDPKLLVPGRPYAAAATIARRHSAPGSLQAAARTALMGFAFASGAGSAVLRDRLVVDLPAGSIGLDDHLATSSAAGSW